MRVSVAVPSVTPGESGKPAVAAPEPARIKNESPWPWEQPANFKTPGRPVAARASRSALIVASVPVATKRTISQPGTIRVTRSASSTSGGDMRPNSVPRARGPPRPPRAGPAGGPRPGGAPRPPPPRLDERDGRQADRAEGPHRRVD